jgi:hypothetical protein
MKTLMVCGAMIGFCLGLALGYAGRVEWPAMLWRACAGAVVLGLLMRWWARVWLRGLRASLLERRAAEAAARQQAAPTSALKK